MLPATTDDRFRADVLEAGEPVLVDFTASWCPPCRVMKPVLEELAAEHALRVVTLDTDDNQRTAAEYGVLGLPTFILFEHGRATRTLTGARPKATLARELALSDS